MGQIKVEIKIDAFQSGGLVKHVRTLAEITKRQSAEIDIVAVATATILLGAAALEAVLSEAAYIHNRSLYDDKSFRKAGADTKFEKLKGYSSDRAKELWEARKAVAHAEPDHSRTRFVGEKLNAKGAEWAATCVEELSKEIWGGKTPEWFTQITGLA